MIVYRHLPILPIVLPFLGAVTALVLKQRPRAQVVIALAAMSAALAASLALLVAVRAAQAPLVFQVGGWSAPFGITMVADLTSALFVVMSQVVLLLGVVYAVGSRERCVGYSTFYPLFLFLATGLTGGFLAGDIFNLFVFLELLAISSTVLTAISDDRYGVEAAYKYFFMSQVAAVLLLLAIGALYVSCGTLTMAGLATTIAANPDRALLPVAAALLTAAFMIKSAVFPFHFWQPDFHTAAPTPVSAMLSSVVVKLGVYGFMRLNTLLFVDHAHLLGPLLTGLGIAGILYGGLGAIGTHNLKRMLAYSTLAQVGFVLVGVGWGTPMALAAAIVFAFNHSLAKAAMLMLSGFVASRASVKSAAFEVVTGVGRPLPFAGALFFIGALALAGIPPTNGFIGKLLLFRSALEARQVWALLAIGAAAVLSLIYTMRAFMRIWWQPAADGITTKPYGDRLYAPALLVALVVVLGIASEPLVAVAWEAAQWMAVPELYIGAVGK